MMANKILKEWQSKKRKVDRTNVMKEEEDTVEIFKA